MKQTEIRHTPAKDQEQLQQHLSPVQLHHGHAALQLRTVAAATHCHHEYCCRPPQFDVPVATGHLSHLHPGSSEELLARSTGIRKSQSKAMPPRTQYFARCMMGAARTATVAFRDIVNSTTGSRKPPLSNLLDEPQCTVSTVTKYWGWLHPAEQKTNLRRYRVSAMANSKDGLGTSMAGGLQTHKASARHGQTNHAKLSIQAEEIFKTALSFWI